MTQQILRDFGMVYRIISCRLKYLSFFPLSLSLAIFKIVSSRVREICKYIDTMTSQQGREKMNEMVKAKWITLQFGLSLSLCLCSVGFFGSSRVLPRLMMVLSFYSTVLKMKLHKKNRERSLRRWHEPAIQEET